MADVDWYRVPGAQFMRGGRWVGGYWNQYTNRIVLAEDGIEHGPMVRHEMLHALLRRDGHPRSQFLGTCSALVNCVGICIEDAGRWQLPQQDYVVTPPESLEVASDAKLLFAERDGQRWLELEVTVRNTRGRAVVVAAPGDPVTPTTFEYDLRGPEGGIGGRQVAHDSSSLFFEPFETKRSLFEFRVTSKVDVFQISPGTYLVQGGYARKWAAHDTVDVTH